MTDEWDIPAFLREAAQAARTPAKARPARGKVPREIGHPNHPWSLPKTMDATAWRLLREEKAERKRRMEERFKMLRARKGGSA